MNDQLDPQAVNLTKAIRQTESGGNFQAKGKSGEYGAYQFTEPTWQKYSQEFGVSTPLNEATPQQQNEVAYKKIKQWKDAGNNVGQIASMWNAGEAKKDAYLGGNEGVNSMGVAYDTGKYAKSVATAYQTLKNGGQVQADPSNPSSTASQPQFPLRSESQVKPEEDKPEQQGYAPGFDNAIGKFSVGTAKGFVGAPSKLGLELADQTVGRVGNFLSGNGFKPTHTADNEVENALNAPSQSGTETAGKIFGLGAGALATGGEALGNVAGRGVKLLPEVEQALGGAKIVGNMSKGEIYNALTDELANGDLPALTKKAIQATIQKIEPSALREAGLSPSLARQVLGGAAKYGWKGIKTLIKAAAPAFLGAEGANIYNKITK